MSPTRTLRKIAYAIQSSADNAQVNESKGCIFQKKIRLWALFSSYFELGSSLQQSEDPACVRIYLNQLTFFYAEEEIQAKRNECHAVSKYNTHGPTVFVVLIPHIQARLVFKKFFLNIRHIEFLDTYMEH